MTEEHRKKLVKVARALMDIWEELPNHDCEEGNDYSYRGGLVKLTVKGGYTDGWVDIPWNDIIADIYAEQKLAHIKIQPYDALVAKVEAESEQRERERLTTPIDRVVEL